MRKRSLTFALLALALSCGSGKPADYLAKPDAWFDSAEGRRITANILSWQTTLGSWPKNVDTTRRASAGGRAQSQGTFDNGATTTEMRFLGRAFQATKDARCEQAFLRGLDHILQAQFPTGGWPQYYPPSKQYHRHITFNDDVMVRLMRLVRDVAESPAFAFVDARRREAARSSFERGLDCILKCQLRVNGRLTAWCAQHDELDYQPRAGRAYELPSISGAESAGVLELLMSVERPTPEIIRAVHAGASWFAAAKVIGLRVARVNGDKLVLRDPDAPPLWARFYDLENGRPLFSDRDGVKKYDFNQLGSERRNGYAWYGDWGLRVEKRYAEWSKSHPRS
ncbi:MAG TPA: pectate lyase [Verrucomicrobiae bacterium]